MKMLFTASEMYPFIKTGGLADVAYALPKALVGLGHDVRVAIPMYSMINPSLIDGRKKVIDVHFRDEVFTINELVHKGIKIYLVENDRYFNRPTLYENDDKDIQFGLFSEVVLRMLMILDFKPDIIHCNDWQTGYIPYFFNQKYRQKQFYSGTRTVYTIHNLRYQGMFSNRALEMLEYPFYSDHINCMKMGITNADSINTVSKTYANEILTDFYGEGLNSELRYRRSDLYGIVNGIDMELFNPIKDPHIAYNFDRDNLIGKIQNKLDLQRILKLPEKLNVPLIGLISRLDPQKGLDLIERVLEEILVTEDVQFVILGSGFEKYENFFKYLANKYPDKISTTIGYNAELAQKIYAGSDMFLMPSLFEPCGLSQLISLRYGTIPIVRETGGLNDTVKSYNDVTNEGNGFSFKNYNAHDMMYTIRRAMKFYNDKGVWGLLMDRALKGDYSWEKSAKEYMDMYNKTLNK
jgi:starch synthase